MKKIFKTLAILGVAGVAAAGVAAFSACDSDKGETYTGEYHYSASGNEYGFKVNVTVKDGKITKVERVASDYVEVTTNYTIAGTWDETNIANWNDNLDDLLKAYEGKTVESVLAATSTISGVGEDETNTVSDSDLVITGATQGSARVLRAVQAALAELAD